jgi:hypothetical protein
MNGILSSCNNTEQALEMPQQKQNELFLQMQDRFEATGIINMIDNYVLQDTDNAMIAASGAQLNIIEDFKFATLKTEYSDGSVVYSFQMPDKSYYVIKIVEKQIVRNFSASLDETEHQLIFNVNEKENLNSYIFDKNTKSIIMDSYQIHQNSEGPEAKDPCDELGSRRPGESYGDCFSRNWRNFCCDFTGCLAQIFNPQLVAVTISLVCIC